MEFPFCVMSLSIVWESCKAELCLSDLINDKYKLQQLCFLWNLNVHENLLCAYVLSQMNTGHIPCHHISLISILLLSSYLRWGIHWHNWLRHCAISWKVSGSIPLYVIGVCHWHNPSGCTMALGSTQPLAVIFPGWKGSRRIGLMTLPPSCADCLEILEPQPPGALRTCLRLYRDCFTFTFIFTFTDPHFCPQIGSLFHIFQQSILHLFLPYVLHAPPNYAAWFDHPNGM
jgi:hypothetical protein